MIRLIAATLALALGASTTSAFTSSLIRRNVPPVSSSSSSLSMIGQLFDLASGKNAARITDIKDEIRSLSRGTDNGLSASDGARDKIAELVEELEGMNPTTKLSSDDKLNGSWELIYTTNEGSSAGKLGPFVGVVEQRIRLPEEYVNFVRIGPLEGALTATWDTLSNREWQVNFQTLKFTLLGIPLLQTKLEAQGTWRKTFLDEDFRILYAVGGKNTEKENIYILAK
eukprot:CAMPEP_0172546194 /NCGR_PEP_ID=MMETSP1067-20121228/15990_1 /TAXON_ID=265564 ORGANISM="Thalassiosira punctigera, Strain Tpunct2005C2" /NCGR_SAMPLE_ID=MMETSP1067 /ASSEMBLY_ACC=CAM_ASM_000444 /LENGTH=226 /DNA_ID=CAMNT_0013333087 /DNA_START=28 /DNA_END=708 /DNA_ORIENTATION=-